MRHSLVSGSAQYCKIWNLRYFCIYSLNKAQVLYEYDDVIVIELSLLSENLYQGTHTFTEYGLIRFKSGPNMMPW